MGGTWADGSTLGFTKSLCKRDLGCFWQPDNQIDKIRSNVRQQKKNQSKGCGSGEWCDDNNRQHNMEIDFLSTKTSLKIIVIQ